jgi:hypothetical protein
MVDADSTADLTTFKLMIVKQQDHVHVYYVVVPFEMNDPQKYP